MKVVGLTPGAEEIWKATRPYGVFPEFPDEVPTPENFPENGGQASA